MINSANMYHAGNEETNFYFILISGRCGSTLLMHYLDQIPDVLCYPEFFVGLDKRAQLIRFEELASTLPVRGYLKSAACSIFPNETHRRDRLRPAAIGAKTKYGDLKDFHGLSRLAGSRGFKAIPMYRHNLVKSAISRIRAQKIHHLYKDYNIPAGSASLGRMTLPLEEFDSVLREERRYIDDINSLAGTYFKDTSTVTYESLMQDPGATLDTVLGFLGSRYRILPQGIGKGLTVAREHAPPIHLIEKTVKATSDNLEEAVENYDALKQHLKGTPFEVYLEESALDHPAAE